MQVFQKSRHTCRISGCGKSYSRKDNLRQHIKSANPDYTSTGIACRYKCDIYGCQKAFYQATLLIKHLEADHKVTVGKLTMMQEHALLQMPYIVIDTLRLQFYHQL